MAAKKKPPRKKKAPAKKKPKRKAIGLKKPAPFNPAAVAQRIPVPQVVVPEPEDATREYIRYSAMIHYTTELNGTTVEKMCTEHPMFKGIPVRTMQKWMTKDKWSERRQEVLESWRVAVEARIGDVLMKKQLEAVKKVSVIRDKLLDRLTHKVDHEYEEMKDKYGHKMCSVCKQPWRAHIDPILDMAPDKLVTSLVKLYEMEISLHETIMRYTTAPGETAIARGNDGVPVKPVLSHDEARKAVQAILQDRLENMREATSGDGSESAS